MMPPRLAEFVRFCMVGGIGFLCDATLLEIGVAGGLAAPYARLISLSVAMQVAYVLNARFTFRKPVRVASAWLKFMLTNALGALINYGIFLTVISLQPFSDRLLSRQAALVCGTGIALFFNFWANKRFAFADKEPS